MRCTDIGFDSLSDRGGVPFYFSKNCLIGLIVRANECIKFDIYQKYTFRITDLNRGNHLSLAMQPAAREFCEKRWLVLIASVVDITKQVRKSLLK
jgi:hypothetical protein